MIDYQSSRHNIRYRKLRSGPAGSLRTLLHRNVQRLRQSRCALRDVQRYVAARNDGGNCRVELVEPHETWSQSLIQYAAGQFLISEEKLHWSGKRGLAGGELADDRRA